MGADRDYLPSALFALDFDSSAFTTELVFFSTFDFGFWLFETDPERSLLRFSLFPFLLNLEGNLFCDDVILDCCDDAMLDCLLEI